MTLKKVPQMYSAKSGSANIEIYIMLDDIK